MEGNQSGAYHIIGMSPGNSYFKDQEISHLLKTVVEKFGKVGILIADIPAVSTYVALGYPENRARRDKAVPKGNALKNRVRKVMEELGYSEDVVRIFDWEHEVEGSAEYQESYRKIKDLYEGNEAFHEAAASTTRVVLDGSRKNIPDIEAATEIAVHYLLSELAFLEFAAPYLGADQVVYVYHKNWRVFEDYVSGKFDGVFRPYLDFLLLENPYETFNPIWGLEDEEGEYDDVLDRVEKTGVLRVGFFEYPTALERDENSGAFSGIFHDVIAHIAMKHGWNLKWVEETGYGVILDGLNADRFDVFGSTVWPTEERDAEFSDSLYGSPVYSWVRRGFGKGEDDLRKEKPLRAVVKEGDITDSIAKACFSDNRRVRVPQLADAVEVLRFVADGRGDFTFAEPYLVHHFDTGSDARLEMASRNPIRVYANTFMMKRGQVRLKNLLDEEIAELKRSGMIAELIGKYAKEGDFLVG